MLFYDTGRKSGEVPIYISGKRNIRISDVGQVHLGVIYALSGSKESCCKYRVQVEGFTEKEYGMVRLENVGDVLFQALLLDDVKLHSKKMYMDFCIVYVS